MEERIIKIEHVENTSTGDLDLENNNNMKVLDFVSWKQRD